MKKIRSNLTKLLGALVCCVLCLYNFSGDMEWLRSLPDTVYVYEGDSSQLDAISANGSAAVAHSFDQSLLEATGEASIDVKLFDHISVKKILLKQREDITVMPGGSIIGLHVITDGIIVVGFGDVPTSNGNASPAKDAGLMPGDIIISANGQKLTDAAHLGSFSDTGRIKLEVARNGAHLTIDITPAKDVRDGQYKLGIWTRDDTAGLGTLSFVTSQNEFAALGHGIKDSDTGVSIIAASGTIHSANVLGITKSLRGTPGEVSGSFSQYSGIIGNISWCSETGTYGSMTAEWVNPLYPDGIKLSYPEEARTGKAQLLASVSGGNIEAYDCRIIKVFRQNASSPRSMIIEVVDDELIDLTGGIVQGMSGSPIIQDGKLIGVITHVLINEPLKGYCLYAWWMYSELSGSASAAA